MPLLREEAEKRVTEDLDSIIVEEIYERGAREVMSQLQFVPTNGEAFTYTLEKELPGGPTAIDPFDTEDKISGGMGKNLNVTVQTGALLRHADVPRYVMQGMRPEQGRSQAADQLFKQSKKLARVFVENMVNGVGRGATLKGFEYWIDYMKGEFGSDYESDIDCGGNPLGFPDLDNLLSSLVDEDYDALYGDRQTINYVKGLIRNMPGNMAEQVIIENFGEQLAYDGTPLFMLDAAGRQKYTAQDAALSPNGGVSIESGETTLTADDASWIGFSSGDVGREVNVTGAGASGQDLTTTITSVNNDGSVELEEGASTSVSNARFESTQQHVLYGVRYDDSDGFCAPYHGYGGDGSTDAGEHYGSIAGFDSIDLGPLQNADKHRRRIGWYGNFAAKKSNCVGRIKNFTIPSNA